MAEPKNPVEVRPASLTSPQVLDLFSQHDRFMMEQLGPDQCYYTPYHIGENLLRVWGAYEGETLLGCVAFRWKAQGLGELKRLFVRPEYRGQGVAQALMAQLLSFAQSQGCSRLYLDTRISLEPAVALYLRFGFQITYQEGLYIQMERNAFNAGPV